MRLTLTLYLSVKFSLTVLIRDSDVYKGQPRCALKACSGAKIHPIEPSASGGIRTHTSKILSLLTLPVGLQRRYTSDGCRPHLALFMRQMTMPTVPTGVDDREKPIIFD